MAAVVAHAQQVVDGLVSQLNQRAEIVTLQSSVGLDVSDAQAAAFIAHLSQLTGLSLDGEARLTRQVRLGPWSSTQMAGIAAAANAAAARTDVSGGTRPPQSCNFLEKYFTQELHDYFKNDNVDVDVASRMVAVQMYNLGLVCPSNQVLKRATSVIQLAGLKVNTLSANSQSTIGKNIRSYIKAMDKEKKFPLAHILAYPDDPSALPAAHLQRAYGSKQPVPFVIEGLPCATASCAYRDSKRGVKEHGSAGAVAPNMATDQMVAAAVNAAIAPLAQIMQQTVGTIPGLQIFGRSKQGASSGAPGGLAAALTDRATYDEGSSPSATTPRTPAPSPPAPTTASSPPSMLGATPSPPSNTPLAVAPMDYDPVADLENAVREAAEAAKVRKARAKAAASADGQPAPKAKGKKGRKTKITKREGKAAVAGVLAAAATGRAGRNAAGAANKTGAAKKRPAAAVVKLRASDFRSEATCKPTYHKGKNDWTSRAYGIAKRRCVSAGMGEDEAKGVAKEVYHMAMSSYERVFGK